MGFFEKLKSGLAKTKDALFKKVDDLFKSFVKVDEDMLEELEELLIMSDVGATSSDASCSTHAHAPSIGSLRSSSIASRTDATVQAPIVRPPSILFG